MKIRGKKTSKSYKKKFHLFVNPPYCLPAALYIYVNLILLNAHHHKSDLNKLCLIELSLAQNRESEPTTMISRHFTNNI